MQRVNANLMAVVLAVVMIGSWGCSHSPYIDVGFRLPPAHDTLAGRTVFVETHDRRSDAEIFNEPAREQFSNFSGLFSLILEEPDNRRTVLGAYELPALFQTAMVQRLQKLGVKPGEQPTAGEPTLQLTIDRFQVNLVDRKWMTEISYEASLTRDPQRVVRERVTGSAQRTQIMGRSGAEKVIGEIFTEMINRLDIEALFHKVEQ